jgi:hypothetical protein
VGRRQRGRAGRCIGHELGHKLGDFLVWIQQKK